MDLDSKALESGVTLGTECEHICTAVHSCPEVWRPLSFTKAAGNSASPELDAGVAYSAESAARIECSTESYPQARRSALGTESDSRAPARSSALVAGRTPMHDTALIPTAAMAAEDKHISVVTPLRRKVFTLCRKRFKLLVRAYSYIDTPRL
ncbi:hypothetical protein A0H81_03037 [Grifola frondosa]|uniref:Uncharacterized protein n=1 Tax=Grifola frondosa TaxID=5627 RepID=A0A1C7MJ22_GRIFR|nr:hypothetical protein A0H81_03037 [Grifola frondosa]